MATKIFKVTITEKLVKSIAVEAENLEEATEKVNKEYLEQNIMLTANDYDGGYEMDGTEITLEQARELKTLQELLD